MRQSLMKTFDQIYILDLHGNSKKLEKTPSGGRDENVFDIEQGVAISVLVKRPGIEKGVWRGDLWGSRLSKYSRAAVEGHIGRLFTPLQPRAPFYLFTASDARKSRAYEDLTSVREIFQDLVAGIITSRDSLSIGFTAKDLKEKVEDFLSRRTDQEASRAYDVDDTRGWTLSKARRELKSSPDWRRRIRNMQYRPFDNRKIAHDERLVDWGRWSSLSGFEDGDLSLVLVRQVAELRYNHALISDALADNRLTRSAKGTCYQIALHKHDGGERSENLSVDFRAFLDARYDEHYTPEEILGYIYAVLYAPTYRGCYAEFLRIDFPRIPFPEDAIDFEALSALGWALVQAHLLREVPELRLADFHGKGGRTMEAVRYSPEEAAIWINKAQRFAPVPQAVWDFHVGGYQVLDKYLKSRKGRVLSLGEITHLAKVADSLAFTLNQMALIDAAYLKAFPQPRPH